MHNALHRWIFCHYTLYFQIRIDRPIILNEDNFIDTAENSADENSEEFLQNQISDCWAISNDSPIAAPM